MERRFDVSTKHLFETYPAAWLAYAGLPSVGPMAVVDADLSAVLAEADKVLRLEAPVPWLVHVEFQASADPTIARRLLRYNVLLSYGHEVAVRSVLVLLRPVADRPDLTGLLRQQTPDGQLSIDFRYIVVRTWEQPVETLLDGALGTLPLAPISAVSEAALPDVIHRMDNRIQQEASPGEAATLWASTYLLMGLRYPTAMAAQLLKGVQGMRESAAYQAILDEGRLEGRAEGRVEGRVEEAQALLLRLGRKRFGPPDEQVQRAIEGIASRERLEELSERLLDVASWDELLAER